jgi:hypothetical protein
LDEDSKNRWQKSIAVGELRTDQLEYARADFATAQIQGNRGGENQTRNKRSKLNFQLKFNEILTITEVTVIPPSFLIGMKNKFLVHFYSRHYENEIEK